jgi:hypothetical protein
MPQPRKLICQGARTGVNYSLWRCCEVSRWSQLLSIQAYSAGRNSPVVLCCVNPDELALVFIRVSTADEQLRRTVVQGETELGRRNVVSRGKSVCRTWKRMRLGCLKSFIIGELRLTHESGVARP